jgi:hypothetical protein
MKIVSWIEKYIVIIILLWDIRLKDNLIVKLFVFFIFYYFDDIIFKNSENECIYESLDTYLVNIIQVYIMWWEMISVSKLLLYSLYICV